MPTETLRADYLLSNEGFASREKLEHVVASFGLRTGLIESRRDVLQPLIVVDTFYLEAALAAIKAQDGTLQDYFEHTLALTAEQRQALRDKLLRPA